MAEDDGGLLQTFLNTQDSTVPGTRIAVVNPDNPVNWLRVFGAIITGIVSSFTSGLAQYPLNAAAAANNLIDAVLSILIGRVQTTDAGRFDGTASQVKIDGVFDVVVGTFSSAAADAWTQSLDQFGIFALPVAFVLVLAAMYLVVQGVRISFALIRGEEVG